MSQHCTAAGRVVGGDRAEIECGLCKFTSHQDVRAKYLKNDCLKMHVYFHKGHSCTLDVSESVWTI